MKRLLGIVSILTLALVISLPLSAGAAGKGKSAPAPDPAVQPAPEPAPATQPAPEPAPAVQPAPAPEPPKGSGVMVGIGDMKISAILQAYFTLAQTQVGDETVGYDTELNNSFNMSRARIFLMGSILPEKVKYVFQGDAVQGGSGTVVPWLLDARLIFVNALPQTEIQVGRFLPNFTYYQPQLVSKLDFVSYPLLTSKYAMWRQVGIQSTTKLGISSLNVGIYNSVSQNCQNTWKDADNWKDFLVRLNIKPNDKIETAVYATFGETGATGTDGYDYLLGVRAGAFLRTTVSGLTALAEILYAMDESDPDNINGIVVYGQAGYKVVPKVEPMVRVEYYEPNLDADNDQTIRLTGGVNYYIIGQNAMLSLNVIEDLKDPENLFTLYTQGQVAF
jgi:hypothetical protein